MPGPDFLKDIRQQLKKAKELFLGSQELSDKSASLLKSFANEIKEIKKLDISRNNLGSQSFVLLLGMLSEIENLDVSTNPIDGNNPEFQTALNQRKDTLKKLNLANTELSSRALFDLASFLKDNTKLEELVLNGIEIPPANLQALCESIQKNPKSALTLLSLVDCYLKHDSLPALIALAQSRNKTFQLDVSKNFLADGNPSLFKKFCDTGKTYPLLRLFHSENTLHRSESNASLQDEPRPRPGTPKP